MKSARPLLPTASPPRAHDGAVAGRAACAPRARRVLAVGADSDWRSGVREALEGTQLTVCEVSTAKEALVDAEIRPPDLLLLDLLLPDVTGLGLCRQVREHPQLREVPIIVVSSFASEADRILAFELGVDDYLPAPFFARELRSRVDAVLRRSSRRLEPLRDDAPQRCGALLFDPGSNRVALDGRDVPLTPTEFRLLGLLIREGGRVLARRRILEQLGNAEGGDSERSVDAHVKAIRRKLGRAREAVETVRGLGYRFAVERIGAERR